MSDDSQAYVQMANELFYQLQLPQTITYIDDLDAGAFVQLFKALCGDEDLGDLVTRPRNDADNRYNLRTILRILSEEILQVSLSHISPEDIISGDKTAICNLLEIFQGLLEYMLNRLDEEERLSKRSSIVESDKEVEKASFEYSTGKDKYRRMNRNASSFKPHEEDRSDDLSDEMPRPRVRIFDMNTSSFNNDSDRSPRQKLVHGKPPMFVLDKDNSNNRCNGLTKPGQSINQMVDETVRQSEEALSRGDDIIDRAHKSRSDSEKGKQFSQTSVYDRCLAGATSTTNSVTTPSENVFWGEEQSRVAGLRSKTDEEYDKLRIHIKRVEIEASRVGHLAQTVAEKSKQQEASQRAREVYLRRKLVEFINSGSDKPPAITPKDPDPRDLEWFQDYSKMHQRLSSRCRRNPVTVGKNGLANNRRLFSHRSNSLNKRRRDAQSEADYEKSLRNYVKDNKLRTNMIQQEAARAATEDAARKFFFNNNRDKLAGTLRRQCQEQSLDDFPVPRDMRDKYYDVKEEMRLERNALQHGQEWSRLKSGHIGRMYQDQLEDIAAAEIDHLYRMREDVMEKENALRQLSSGRIVGGPDNISILKPSGSLVKPIQRRMGRPVKVKTPSSSKYKGNGHGERLACRRRHVNKSGNRYSYQMRGSPGEYYYPDNDNAYSDEDAVSSIDKDSWRSSQLAAKSLPENPNDEELLEFLLGEFPYLHLSKQTVRELWNRATRQASIMSRTNYDARHQKCKEQILVEEAQRRQQILSDILRKEVVHNQRLREHREQQATRRAVMSRDRELKQQHSKCKKYYDEFVTQMRSKMLKKRTREEQIFRKLFQEALKLQRERLQDMRKYARELRCRRSEVEQNELESLENFYRDRFRMLADSLAEERQEINTQEKAQNQLLKQMKRELRSKLEADIGDNQDDIIRVSEDPYFRQLDANRSLKHLRSLRYKP